MKRVFDVLFTLIFLPVWVPMFLVISLAIMLDSKGPVFYRGLRAGINGKPFRIYKFRSMVLNADKIGGGTTALNDKRITKLGFFLRKYKLDELPQVLNVLRGEMSLVGPRPELLQYTEKYNEHERIILTVKPGITDVSSIVFSSLDEVVGCNNADAVYEKEVYPRKNALRIAYVEKRSFRGDLNILLLTIEVILKKALQKA